MEQSTQAAPSTANPPVADRPESTNKPLPSTERDFHTRPSRTQSPGFRIAVLIALVVLIVVGFFVYRYFTSYESTDDAQVDGHITPVAAKIYGRVAEVLVNDNQSVKAGQILVRLDPADDQAAANQAKAALALAEDEARSAGVDVPRTTETTNSGTSSADAQLAGAQADLKIGRAHV